jgi:hypothetical protein
VKRKSYGMSFKFNILDLQEGVWHRYKFYLLASLLHNCFSRSFIHWLEEWNNYYEVIMSLTDAAVMFGPFSESFISLRNMDKFCVNLETSRTTALHNIIRYHHLPDQVSMYIMLIYRCKYLLTKGSESWEALIQTGKLLFPLNKMIFISPLPLNKSHLSMYR